MFEAYTDPNEVEEEGYDPELMFSEEEKVNFCHHVINTKNLNLVYKPLSQKIKEAVTIQNTPV